MRLDKFLAECSGNTRSEVKKWLKAGGVTVNGAPVSKPETKIDPEKDVVALQGKQLFYSSFVGLVKHQPDKRGIENSFSIPLLSG